VAADRADLAQQTPWVTPMSPAEMDERCADNREEQNQKIDGTRHGATPGEAVVQGGRSPGVSDSPSEGLVFLRGCRTSTGVRDGFRPSPADTNPSSLVL
jgi:hypothetical protein